MRRWGKGILKTIEDYDFILVDSNFIDDISVGKEQDLCRVLYDVDCFTELEEFKENFEGLHYELLWKLEDVVKRDNVFTVKGVIDEIVSLKDIFSGAYKWHMDNFKMAVSKNSFSFNIPTDIRCDPASLRRMRSFREKIIRKLRENEEESKSFNGPFELLNCLIVDLQEIINHFKIYEAESKIGHHFSVPDASETDYALVNAAMDYLSDSSSKAGIISSDKHIWQIRNGNNWDTYFDVITLRNYTKLPKCSVN